MAVAANVESAPPGHIRQRGRVRCIDDTYGDVMVARRARRGPPLEPDSWRFLGALEVIPAGWGAGFCFRYRQLDGG